MRTILCLLVLSVAIHAEEPAKPTVAEQAEIKKLLTQTKDYEPNKREKACVLLASYGSKAMEVVPRLKEMIEKDLNGSARVAALAALCEIDLKTAKPILNEEALNSAFPAVRVSALQLLTIHEPKEKSSLATAKAAMKDRNSEVVIAACLMVASHKLRTEDDFNSATAELTRRTMEKKPEPAMLALLQIKAIELLNPKKPKFLSLVEYRNLTISWESSGQEYSQKQLASFVKTHTEAIVTDMLVTLTRKGDGVFDQSCLDMMNVVLKHADMPKAYEHFASLDLKTLDEARLKVVLDHMVTAATKGMDMPLQAAVQKPELPMSKLFLSVASQRGLGMLVMEEDVLKLIQSADATLNDHGLRFALGKQSETLTKAALAKVYPANSGNANLVAAVYRDYTATLSEKKEPAPTTVTLLKTTWAHANEDVRGIGVAASARIGLLAKVPLDELRPLLIDKTQRVRGYAFTSLADRSKTDDKAKLLLDELAESKDEDIKLLAKLARAGTLKIDASPTTSWLIDEDTTAIVDVQIRSILDFLPIKKRLNKKLRDEVKQSPLIRQFEFDPLTELFSAQFALSETRDSTALLTGDFKRDRQRTPLLIEGANNSYAQIINDSTLFVATTKTKLEDIVKREFKPLKLAPEKQPLLAVIPAKPTGSVLWIASRWPSVLIDGSLLKSVGIDAMNPALVKASPIFLITLDIEKTEVVFRWTVPSVKADDQEKWKAYLEKWMEAYKTFATVVGGNILGLQKLIADSTKSINVKIVDKTAVVLSFRISIAALDSALDVLMPGDGE